MCNCIELTNKAFKEHPEWNTILDIPFSITISTGKVSEPRCLVATTKDNMSKKHGRPRPLFATYCPFCGEKYQRKDEQ